MNNIMVVLKTNNYSDVPRLLLEKITSDEAGDFFEQFTQKDQGNDMLRDFFQERYAARKDLKQDYTPGFISKYLTTINLQIDSVGEMEIAYEENEKEQLKAVNLLNIIESENELSKKVIDKANELKQVLLNKMFI